METCFDFTIFNRITGNEEYARQYNYNITKYGKKGLAKRIAILSQTIGTNT